MFVIGKILKPHGLRGDVRVMPTTDDPERFSLLTHMNIIFEDSAYCESGSKVKTLTVERVWHHKGLIIIKFEEINDMTEADKLRGGIIRIEDGEALPLGDDEYYVRDLYGMTVVTDEGEPLGEIKDVLQTGGNDVYVVGDELGQVILIPAIKQCIGNIDINSRRMVVTLMEGLRP
jgi:16S rRNA processing protein RimM